jgi:hypothetical protein
VLDTARAAWARGITSTVFTNGFCSPAAAHAIATAPGVCHIILGVKGSLDPAFYATWMRSPGAVEAVKASALAFRDAGIRISFTDTIPSLHMQSDDDAEQHQAAYYAWIAEHFGPLACLRVGELHEFNDNRFSRKPLLSAQHGDKERYAQRVLRSIELARAAGLHYVWGDDLSDTTRATCHACGATLVVLPPVDVTHDGRQRYQMHWQFIKKSGECHECGAAVPVCVLPMDFVRTKLKRGAPNTLMPGPGGMGMYLPSCIVEVR